MGACADDHPLARAPSRFAVLDGARVHYRSIGGGRDAVVFVHGWCGNLEFWKFQARALEGKVRAIYLDLPGHGRSDQPEPAPFTMDHFARATEAVIRDAGVDRAVLVGHSNGTPVVRQFLRLFPARTAGLVAVDGALRPAFESRERFDAWVARLRGDRYRDRAAKIVDGMTAPMAPHLREFVRTAMLSTPQTVMVRSFEATGDPAIWAEDPIAVPLLVVLARSPFWTAEYETFVRRLAPHVEWSVLDGVGHFLMMDRPDDFNRILLEFVSRTL